MILLFDRTDRKMTRLTGLLCGLGWDPVTQAPMLADHDIELAFDTKIRNEDVSKVLVFLSLSDCCTCMTCFMT